MLNIDLRKEVMFFSPYSGIWPHSVSEHQLARNIDKRRFKLSIVNCGGVLDLHCAVKESKKIYKPSRTNETKKVCSDCVKCAAEVGNEVFDYQIYLADRISRKEIEEIETFVNNTVKNDFINLVVDGIEIGRLTAYETLIKFKKTSIELTDYELNHWKTSLFQGLITLRTAKRIIDERMPSKILIYSPQYSSGSVFAEYARLRGIQTYFVEGSSNIAERYSAVRIWDWEKHGLVNPALSSISLLPVANDEEMARVIAHLNEIAAARSFSVYSPKASKKLNIREHFKIHDHQRVLIAAISSYDESYSAYILGRFPLSKYQGQVFKDQFDWISQLIQWAVKNPKHHVIIRLHPRDLSTRRENVVSEQSQIWRDLLRNLPENVSVDYPEDEISIFDYYDQVDAYTTGWSSTALEAMINGVPAVTYDSGMPSYPSSIHFTGTSKEEYFHNLEVALTNGRNDANHINAINWWALNFAKGTVRLPGRLQEHRFVKHSNVFVIAVKILERLLPRISHKIDMRISRNAPVSLDSVKLNTLLDEGKLDLFYESV